MRRRRLLAKRTTPGRQLPATSGGTDLLYLQHVVCVRFPVRDARTYLRRAVGNDVKIRLVEARRGVEGDHGAGSAVQLGAQRDDGHARAGIHAHPAICRRRDCVATRARQHGAEVLATRCRCSPSPSDFWQHMLTRRRGTALKQS